MLGLYFFLKPTHCHFCMNKTKWEQSYDLLSIWLNTYGFQVMEKVRADDSICFETKTVLINSQYKEENKLYTLLHECGHLIIYMSSEDFKKHYPMHPSSMDHDGRVLRSKAYKVSLIGEEIVAWQAGRNLAEDLGIVIDEENYSKAMVDAVHTYIEWEYEKGE